MRWPTSVLYLVLQASPRFELADPEGCPSTCFVLAKHGWGERHTYLILKWHAKMAEWKTLWAPEHELAAAGGLQDPFRCAVDAFRASSAMQAAQKKMRKASKLAQKRSALAWTLPEEPAAEASNVFILPMPQVSAGQSCLQTGC